jgi:hypothetical protein
MKYLITPTCRHLQGFAACLLILVASFTGCSKQTGIAVAQEIVNWTPAVTNAVNTIDATASLLLPTEAVIFTVATAGFDAASSLVTQYAQAYLANPTANTLTNLQTAITTLEQNVNSALLQSAGIKDANSQKLALAAINGLGTIAATLLGLIQSISSKAQLDQMHSKIQVTLARVRPLMDAKGMQQMASNYHITVDGYFDYEASHGF